MRVLFERTGGFAGLKLQTSLDSDTLSAAESRQLRTLIKKSRFFELPAELKSPEPGRDRFSYRLTVETEEGARTVDAQEAAIPDTMRPLLDWLMQFTRR